MITFVHITDTHVVDPATSPGSQTASRFATMVDDINRECPEAAFVVHTGDIGGMAGEADTYRAYRELAERLDRPVHYTLGNHDDRARFRQIVTDAHEPAQGTGEDPWGADGETQGTDAAPYHWAFDHASWSFVGVDSSEGSLPDSEMSWLAETLGRTRQRPTFLFLHHHPLPIGNGLDKELMLGEPMKVLTLIHLHPQVRGVAFGHMHLTRTLYLSGTTFYCTPSPAFAIALEPVEEMITGSDASYRIFNIQDDGSIETWIRHLEEP